MRARLTHNSGYISFASSAGWEFEQTLEGTCWGAQDRQFAIAPARPALHKDSIHTDLNACIINAVWLHQLEGQLLLRARKAFKKFHQ